MCVLKVCLLKVRGTGRARNEFSLAKDVLLSYAGGSGEVEGGLGGFVARYACMH